MAKGCALSTGYLLWGGLPRNSVDRITDRPDMTSAVDRGRKASNQTKKQTDKDPFLKRDYAGCTADLSLSFFAFARKAFL